MPLLTHQTPKSISGGSGGITESQHRALDQLVHEIAETNYYEITYDGTYTWRTSSEIWWTTSGKTQKIREILYTYDGTTIWKTVTIVIKQYDGTGTLEETLTGTVTYSGVFVDNIDWVLT